MSALVTNFSSDGQQRTVSVLSYSYQWHPCVFSDAEPRPVGSFWGQKIKAQVGRGWAGRPRGVHVRIPDCGGLLARSEPECAVRVAACVCVRATAGQGKDPVTHARHSRASRSLRAEFVAHSRPTPRTIANQVVCVRAVGPVRVRSRLDRTPGVFCCSTLGDSR